MKGVSKARLLSFLGSESLDRFEIKVVVKMQIVKILAMNQQVQHIVSLTADLQPALHPIELRRLKEFGLFEGLEERLLVHGFGRSSMQFIEHPHLEQFLVAHTDFHGIVRRAMLLVPRLDQWHVLSTTSTTRARVKGMRGVVEGDAVGSFLIEEREVVQ